MTQHVRRSIYTTIVLAAALNVVAVAQAPRATAGNASPPLIDRQLIFGDPEISGSQLSPDGRYMSFLKPFKGTRNIWVKRTSEPFDQAKPITAETRRPIGGYFWSRDSKYLLYVQDQGGDENFNVYVVNPSEEVAAGSQVPAARNITGATGLRTQIYAVPKSEPDAIYIGINDRDNAWHDLYKVRISTGEKTLLRANTERLMGWVFDRSDKVRLAVRAAQNGDTEILRVDEAGFTMIYSCSVFETCGPVQFHKDGQRVYLLTNKGADLTRLTLLDVQSMKEEVVESDPLNRVDLLSAIFSEKTNDLIATMYIDDKPRYIWKDKAWEADYNLLKQKFPGKEVRFQSITADEGLAIVTAFADVDPGTVHLFNRPSKALTPQYVSREKLPREALSPMTSIRYKSSDGLEIPAYLTLPKGAEPKSLPLIVMPHGGPWARDVWGYDSLAQFLANRGYAVLQPNFRGSMGYGKKFLDAGDNQWGEKMQDDITWGVRHLVAAGTVDAKRVGIFGISYGGYATLAGAAFTPDIYAAGASFVGPSNLITLLNSVPPYWESARKMFHVRMGDPSTPEGKAQLERQSPLNSAAKIKTPLLVIQGANDPRVKKAESEQIVIALRDRGAPVEYLLAPDEGHGFARPINNMATYAAIERFFAKHLNGRYQEDMSAEVAERLKAITVDPKTVSAPTTVSAASAETPRVAGALKPGTTTYQAKIEVAGKSLQASTTIEIKEENGAWTVTETAKLPTGEATDRVVLAKDSLVVQKRSISQGPMSIDFEVAGAKAAGAMKMGGQERPIAVDLGGDLFADGPGASAVVAMLPLAEGYAAAYRNLDFRTMQINTVQLKVVGSEQVTLPSGTFDTFKVETNSSDGTRTTLWVDKNTRTPVKQVAIVPAMNGATVTMELQK